MEEEPKKKKLEIVELVFWIAFIIIPFATGILAYHWLPNESPMVSDGQILKPFKILQSHQKCDDNGNCATIPDVWQNTNTGKIYTNADFQSHRISQRNRLTIEWFIYGLVGCFFYAFTKHYRKESFYKSLGTALIINIGVSAYTYLTIAN